MDLRWHISDCCSYCKIAVKTAVYYKPCLQFIGENSPFRVIANQARCSPVSRIRGNLGPCVWVTDCNVVMIVYVVRGFAHLLITPHTPLFEPTERLACISWSNSVSISRVRAANVNQLLKGYARAQDRWTEGRKDVLVVGTGLIVLQ